MPFTMRALHITISERHIKRCMCCRAGCVSAVNALTGVNVFRDGVPHSNGSRFLCESQAGLLVNLFETEPTYLSYVH